MNQEISLGKGGALWPPGTSAGSQTSSRGRNPGSWQGGNAYQHEMHQGIVTEPGEHPTLHRAPPAAQTQAQRAPRGQQRRAKQQRGARRHAQCPLLVHRFPKQPKALQDCRRRGFPRTELLLEIRARRWEGSRRDFSWAGSYGRSFAWEGACGVVTGSQGRSFSWAGLQGACPQSWLGQPGQLTLTGWFLDLGSCFTCLTASTRYMKSDV